MAVNLNPEMHKYGKLACIDSGPVAGADHYTTLVMIHGYGYHSAQFQRLLPTAAKAGVRVVLVQRRDFPGSDPLTDNERAQLQGTEHLDEYMRQRAKDVHDFLTAFVVESSVPKKTGSQGGGIVLSGWSFAATWLTAFVSNAPSFEGEIDLSEYIRQTILYDPPNHSLGIPFPAETYLPLTDEAIAPQDRALAFARWVSGYFTHGDTEETLERRVPDTDRPPTIMTFSPEEVQAFFSPGPASPGGSDHAILHPGFASGLNGRMWETTLFPGNDDAGRGSKDWADIPMRVVWCDRSGYEMTWAMWYLRRFLDEAKAAGGRRMRDVEIICLEGANHFAHWDEPERLFRTLVPLE